MRSHTDPAFLRADLAERSMWNVGYFVAGCLLWLAIFAAGQLIPLEEARFVWIAATFFTLPAAVLPACGSHCCR